MDEEAQEPQFNPLEEVNPAVFSLTYLLSDENHPAPKWVKEFFWPSFDKEFALGNISKKEHRAMYYKFEGARALGFLALGDDLTWADIAQIEYASLKFMFKTSRSIYGFERRMETSRIAVYKTQKVEEEEEGES